MTNAYEQVVTLINRFGPLRALRVLHRDNSLTGSYYLISRITVVVRTDIDLLTFTPDDTHGSLNYEKLTDVYAALAEIGEAEARVFGSARIAEWLDEIQNHILHDRWPFDLPPPDKETP